MTDREKIIKEWEAVLSRDPLDAPWDLIDDTLALLKEQEPVKPVVKNGTFWCGKCGNHLKRIGVGGDHLIDHFCGDCGQAVKWE